MDFEDQVMICYMTIFLTNGKEYCFVVTFLIGAYAVSIGVPQGSIFRSFTFCFVYQ